MAAVAEPGSAAIRPTSRAEAAAPLAATPDTAESQREDANDISLASADDRPRADDFQSEILVMARG
jgi:hypothetical protein